MAKTSKLRSVSVPTEPERRFTIATLVTSTNNVATVINSLDRLGHEAYPIVYDEMTDGHANLHRMVAKLQPDFVIYVGALAEHHGKPVPTIARLAEIGADWPLVHLCFDGAEPVWWPRLEEYYEQGRFALQVNIDGVRAGPIGLRGMIGLCPIDHASFIRNADWNARPVWCGFAGGLWGNRRTILAPLIENGKICVRARDTFSDSYDLYARFLGMCRASLNVPQTGGGTGDMHVKARVLESALAGCVVLEGKGSPLSMWFTPGEDYLEYENADEVAVHVEWVSSHPEESRKMASNMREKVISEYSPTVFWSQVFNRLGLGPALRSELDLPLKRWNAPGSAVPVLAADAGPYNIVVLGARVFGVPKTLGPIDLAHVETRANPEILKYSTLAEAKKALRVS